MKAEESVPDFLVEGLRSYPLAKEAVAAFEDLLIGLAKEVVLEHWSELEQVTNVPDDQSKLWETDRRRGSHVGVGVSPPGTWGLVLGIRWPSSEESRSRNPVACVAVRLSANYKKEKLLKSLAGHSVDVGRIEASWETAAYEVRVVAELESQPTREALRRDLQSVFSSFLERVRGIGGLRTGIGAG